MGGFATVVPDEGPHVTRTSLCLPHQDSLSFFPRFSCFPSSLLGSVRRCSTCRWTPAGPARPPRHPLHLFLPLAMACRGRPAPVPFGLAWQLRHEGGKGQSCCLLCCFLCCLLFAWWEHWEEREIKREMEAPTDLGKESEKASSVVC